MDNEAVVLRDLDGTVVLCLRMGQDELLGSAVAM